MVNSTLMVIDPSITHPEIASFNKIVRHSPFPCTYHLPAMSSMDSISRTLSNSCGLIILGSAASVLDQSDWQSKLGSILDKAIKFDLPILGICFGHQFIAHQLGGKVDYLWKKDKKIGTRKVHVQSSSLIKSNKTYDLIYSHQEGVVMCPDDFYVSAYSKMVDIEAINHNSKAIWGFQAHVEASSSFAHRHGISDVIYNSVKEDGSSIMESFFDKI